MCNHVHVDDDISNYELNNLHLKYQRFTSKGHKDIEIEFVAKNSNPF